MSRSEADVENQHETTYDQTGQYYPGGTGVGGLPGGVGQHGGQLSTGAGTGLGQQGGGVGQYPGTGVGGGPGYPYHPGTSGQYPGGQYPGTGAAGGPGYSGYPGTPGAGQYPGTSGMPGVGGG